MSKDGPYHASYISVPGLESYTKAKYVFNPGSSEETLLGPLSAVNLFVGPNNSGKSRIIRALFASNIYRFRTSRADDKGYAECVQRRSNAIEHLAATMPDRSWASQILELKNIAPSIDGLLCYPDTAFYKIRAILRNYSVSVSSINATEDQKRREWLNEWKQVLDGIAQDIDDLGLPVDFENTKRFYIPILRGMRQLLDTDTDCYKKRTKSDYFHEATLDFNIDVRKNEIFTGYNLYNLIDRAKRGSIQNRDAFTDFENFLAEEFFDASKIELTAAIDDNIIHVRLGSEPDFAISNIGDGMQNLIILLFNVFLQKEPGLFFIEEPEISMHPGLQRAFLRAISAHKQHQFFITTHSNHFLDMAEEFDGVSIFLVNKRIDDEGVRFQVRSIENSERVLLESLGVRNSSAFITNTTIWIEGSTDRLYVRYYLDLYKKLLEDSDNPLWSRYRSFREDFHYSFVEYQGSCLTHWGFGENQQPIGQEMHARTLCGRALVIADGDIRDKGFRAANLEDSLGLRFLLLDGKEVENLIPVEILKEVVKEEFRSHSVSTEALDYTEYSTLQIGLGQYLDRKLGLKDGQHYFSAETKSGTLNSSWKQKICTRVTTLQVTDINLPEPVTNLCKRVLEHIYEFNK